MAVLRALSTVWMLTFALASFAHAHEVLPSIGDFRTENDRVVFDIRANVESFLAEIDLTEVTNTGEAAQADTYDTLRQSSAEDLAARFEAFWPSFAQGLNIVVDGQRLTPELIGVAAEPVGDIELVRETHFTFAATLPPQAETLVFSWAPENGILVLRQMDVPAPYDAYLEAGAATDPIPLSGGGQATGWETFFDYIPVGFDHIVPKGLDHILFVLGLFFLAAHFRPLLLQVSLFTLAHTITLALAALGYVKLPGSLVEPLIAASIVFVALENIWAKGISRWRPYIIFGFGLLHGLGFASVLGEFGLPEGTFVAALIGFNVGVEVGQLAVITLMFLCVWQAVRIDRGANEAPRGLILYASLLAIAVVISLLNPAGLATLLENPVWLFAAPLAGIFALSFASIMLRDQIDAYRRIVAIPASVAIAAVGAYWFIERVFL